MDVLMQQPLISLRGVDGASVHVVQQMQACTVQLVDSPSDIGVVADQASLSAAPTSLTALPCSPLYESGGDGSLSCAGTGSSTDTSASYACVPDAAAGAATAGVAPAAAGVEDDACCDGECEAAERAAAEALNDALDLMTCVDLIAAALRRCRRMHLSKRAAIARYLQLLDVSGGELSRYAHFDAGKKYTRNLVATDNETFTIMLLCWNAGKESPIHDHPCDGCWMRVVAGGVVETRYRADAATNTLQRTAVTTATAGDVIYINDSIGLHKVATADAASPAITLHVYSPPFRECSVWLSDGAAADKPLRPVVTYHSAFGEVVDYEASALCQ